MAAQDFSEREKWTLGAHIVLVAPDVRLVARLTGWMVCVRDVAQAWLTARAALEAHETPAGFSSAAQPAGEEDP